MIRLQLFPVLVCLIFCTLLPSTAVTTNATELPLAPTSCQYLETIGQNKRQFTWTLQKTHAWFLTSVDPRETHRTWLDNDLQTRMWSLERPDDQTAVKVRRYGENLHMEGTVGGRNVQRDFALGGHPWYQALSVSLRSQTARALTSAEFWVLRPDTLEPVLLTVASLRNERLEVGAGSMDTVRVEIRPTGWKAPFWKGIYWFGRHDCSFVRFEGDSGLPGLPPTIITLVGEDKP